MVFIESLILTTESSGYKAPNLKNADRIVQKDTLTTMTHCDPTY